MELETERLVLRPWLETDAESLYTYAKDPAVGPIAGWPPHISPENSLEIIRNVLAVEETYAVCLKKDNRAIGSIGLKLGKASNLGLPDTEGEIGYWIGVPFWGRGLIPEAVKELLRHGFQDLKPEKIWCGYFDGNSKSRKVQEKCGFTYQYTNKDIYWKLMDDIRSEHFMQSELLFSSREKESLDWDTINRLVDSNPHFKNFPDSLMEDIKIGKIKSNYDETYSDEEQMYRYALKSGILSSS